MAGGTGGHVFPALALARLLRARSGRGRLARHAARTRGARRPGRAHPDRVAVDRRPARQGRARRCWPPRSAWRCALVQALRVMRRHRPLIVVGLGGFVTGPGGVAAWLTRRPLIIHEQNAVAGFTNRCLAHLARAGAGGLSRQLRARACMRASSAIRCGATSAPCRRRRSASPARSGPIRILVIGGSQGAARLNADRALRAQAPGRHARLRRAPPGRRALARGRPRQLRAGRRARRRAPLHRGHERGLRLGGSGDLPLRRADGLGAGGRRRRRDPGAVPGRGRRSPDAQRAVPGATRAPRC